MQVEQYYWCPNCFNVFDEPGFTREWVADEFGEHCGAVELLPPVRVYGL